jgi:hypothetical protein
VARASLGYKDMIKLDCVKKKIACTDNQHKVWSQTVDQVCNPVWAETREHVYFGVWREVRGQVKNKVYLAIR